MDMAISHSMGYAGLLVLHTHTKQTFALVYISEYRLFHVCTSDHGIFPDLASLGNRKVINDAGPAANSHSMLWKAFEVGLQHVSVCVDGCCMRNIHK